MVKIKFKMGGGGGGGFKKMQLKNILGSLKNLSVQFFLSCFGLSIIDSEQFVFFTPVNFNISLKSVSKRLSVKQKHIHKTVGETNKKEIE